MRFTEILELFPEGRPRRTGAEDRFWDEIARLGTPLVDSYASDSSLRDVTFLFRAAGPEVRSVRLVANRVTDKHRQATGLPPLVVVGIGAADREQRIETLGGHHDFLKDICVTLLPQIERELRQRGCSLPERSRRIVSGQSLGGLSSLLMALVAPEAFGTVLAQSASLWWRPGGEASPTDLSRADPGRGSHDDWLTGRFLDSDDPDVALHLTVGSREGLMVDQHRRLHEVLLDRDRTSTLSVCRGGHDCACWRGALINGLRTLLVLDAESPAGARNAPDSANSPQE